MHRDKLKCIIQDIGRCRRLHRIAVQRVCRVGRLDLLITRRVALYIATSKGAIGFASYPDQNY